MKILSLDTTTRYLSLGLHIDGKFCEYTLDAGRKLSALLAPSIKRALEAAGLPLEDIDYFVSGLGPGSFTGIRAGLATIKALSLIHHKPVVGVSTLDVMALNAGMSKRLIVPAIDAKRGLIYCSIYKNTTGKLKRLSPYLLIDPLELSKKITSGALIFGDALDLYKDKISASLKDVSFLGKDYWFPRAHNLMELALERIKEKKISNAFEIKPIYLYPKECQVRTKELR